MALYIESVYDGHFALAQIGKQLAAGYAKLGGATAFGRSLTPAQVQQLAATLLASQRPAAPARHGQVRVVSAR